MAGADTAETSSVTPPAADAASASTTPPTEASEENVPPDQQPGGHAADDATQQQPGAPQQLASEGQEGTTAAAATSTAIVAAAKPGVHPVPIPMGGMDGVCEAAQGFSFFQEIAGIKAGSIFKLSFVVANLMTDANGDAYMILVDTTAPARGITLWWFDVKAPPATTFSTGQRSARAIRHRQPNRCSRCQRAVRPR